MEHCFNLLGLQIDFFSEAHSEHDGQHRRKSRPAKCKVEPATKLSSISLDRPQGRADMHGWKSLEVPSPSLGQDGDDGLPNDGPWRKEPVAAVAFTGE